MVRNVTEGRPGPSSAAPVLGAEVIWRRQGDTIASMGSRRRYLASVALNGFIYVMGGYGSLTGYHQVRPT